MATPPSEPPREEPPVRVSVRADLAALLKESFTPDELRRFIHDIDADYDARLPEGKSREELAYLSAELLERENAVPLALARVRIVRPLRVATVDELRRRIDPNAPPPAPPTASPAPPPSPTPTELGGYRLGERLDTGDRHQVYSAVHPTFGKAAVRVWPSVAADLVAAESAGATFKSLAHLDAPNVLRTYRGGVDHHRPWQATLLLQDARTLADHLREPRRWRHVLRVFLRVGRGLAAAHACGLVHRDVRPANVLVIESPQPRQAPVHVVLIGFCLEVDEARGFVGDPRYACPERHKPSLGPQTAASDQFSFCIALYEALYGTHPLFRPERVSRLASADLLQHGSHPDLAAVLSDAICGGSMLKRPESATPKRFLPILRHGLRSSPSDRHASMDVLLRRLEYALWRPYMIAAALLALLGAAVVVYLLIVEPPVPALCKRDTAVADARLNLWDRGDAAAVEHSFRASGYPFAGVAFAAVDRDLTDYADAWAAVHSFACAEGRASGWRDQDVYLRRARCLAGGAAEFTETIRTFIDRPDSVLRTNLALASLPPLGDCAAVAADDCRAPAARLADARTHERTGRFAEAVAAAAEAQAFAEAKNDRLLLASSAFLAGRALFELGRWPEAKRALQTAHDAAQQAQCPALALDIANRKAKGVALEPSEPPEARDEVTVVFEKLHALYPADRQLSVHESYLRDLRVAEAHNNRGVFHARKSNTPGAAQDDLERGLNLRKDLRPAPLADVSASHRNLGAVLFKREQDAALRQFRDGLDSARRAFGAGHPATWKAHFDLGKALGTAPDARFHLEEALRLAGLVYDPENVKIGEAYFELELYHSSRGDHGAERQYAIAAGNVFKHLPPGHPRRINAQRMLAFALMMEGDYHAALKIREKQPEFQPGDYHEPAIFHLELAEVQAALGDWKHALEHADAALVLIGTGELDITLRGEALLSRGLALAGLRRPGALVALQEAERILRQKLNERMIDPLPWIHAAWEATLAACEPTPDALRQELASQSWPNNVPALVDRIRRAVADHDQRRCHHLDPP